MDLGLGLAHRHGISGAATHPPHACPPAGAAGEEEESREEGRGQDQGLGEVSEATGGLVRWQDSDVYLVRCELREEVGVVGEGLELKAGPVRVYPEELGAVGREGHLLDAIAVDEPEEVGVPNVDGGTAPGLDHRHLDGGFGGGGGGVHGHGEADCPGGVLGGGGEGGRDPGAREEGGDDGY